MPSHEYRVIPAPRRAQKVKGLRSAEDRFAHAIESEMNRMAGEGWEFVRSDTLPCEQKAGWFSRPVTVFQTLLVFRRASVPSATEHEPHGSAMPPPVALTPPLSVAAPPVSAPAPSVRPPAARRFTPAPAVDRPANLTERHDEVTPTLTLVEPEAVDASTTRRAAE